MSKFEWSKINKPVIALAPMANITTLPFRSICREMGADIVFTPMISSNALVYHPEKTLKIAEFLPEEQPVIVQIFGYDGELIAKAANIVSERLHPAGIDINMGCPAPKIARNECGAALLKNYDKAKKIIKKVRSAFSGQLSVKLRLGWDKFDVLPFVKYLEKIGVDAIAVHGRTARQGYSGSSEWEAIYKIAESVKIPVIGNGDITNWRLAISRLLLANSQKLIAKSCLAGIMIGRAALGNPWIFKEIEEKLSLGSSLHSGLPRQPLSLASLHSSHSSSISLASDAATRSGNIPRLINKKELAQIIDKQTKRYIDYVGEKIAIMEMRKHLGWYIRGFPGALNIRKKAMQVKTYQDVKKMLEMIK